MGMQRIVIDLYYSHEGAVAAGQRAIAAVKDMGYTPTAASVVNHPGEADESTTVLVAPLAPADGKPAESEAEAQA